MKALFSRLHRSTTKEKDVAAKDRDRDKGSGARSLAATTTTEKVPQDQSSLLPAIPPSTALISPDFIASSHASDPTQQPQSNRSSNRQSRGISQHGTNRGSAASRPPSQFELSLQKPLPDLSSAKPPLPPPPEVDEEPLQGRAVPREQKERVREPSQSTTATSSRATAHDSQGRSTTLSKQSQSTHFNSVSTDNTSISGSATPPAAAAGQQPPPPAAGGTKKVAFISPPPTPGGLSITAPLPDLVTDLNSPIADGAQQQQQQQRSASSSHAHSHSLSKATSFPNGTSSTGGAGPAGSNVVATGSTTNLSLKNGRLSSMSQVSPSSTKNTPPKASAASSSSNRAATSPAAQSSRGAFQTFHQGGSTARAASRAEFAQSVLSLRSGTPYSHMSGKSAIQMPASWSEAAEEDLVSNLGPRERTRQEVLWEIVASEQRYAFRF